MTLQIRAKSPGQNLDEGWGPEFYGTTGIERNIVVPESAVPAYPYEWRAISREYNWIYGDVHNPGRVEVQFMVGDRKELDQNNPFVVERERDRAIAEQANRNTEALIKLMQEGGFRPPSAPKQEDILPPTPINNRWAVVIGISDYADDRVGDLNYAAADANAFYGYLTDPNGGAYDPSRVRLLTDADATKEQFSRAMTEFLGNTVEEDLVVIFIAGHGSPPDPTDDQNLYLLPHDVDPTDIRITAYHMDDIRQDLDRHVAAKRVIVFADTCHSGGIGAGFEIDTAGKRGLGQPVAVDREKVRVINQQTTTLAELSDRDRRAGYGRVVISAASGTQLAQERSSAGGGHGVFTWRLMEGLRGNAETDGDGKVSLAELWTYVSLKVREDTGSSQEPQISGAYDPTLILRGG